MSHASTATIKLGGVGGDGPGQAQYSAPPVQNNPSVAQPAAPDQNDASQGRRRARRRQNVPDHMRHGGDHQAPGRQQSPTQPKYGGSMGYGTSYVQKPTPNAQSSTPAQVHQTQTLFPAQKQGNVRFVPQVAAPTSAPAQYGHSQNANTSDVDERRAAEAREKLIAMNLSEQVIAQYRRRFNVLDLDKDGVVNLREFAAISRVLGYSFSKEEILEVFGRRDLDDSGGISFDEFVLAMYARSQKSKELAPYREKFRLYDVRSRGYITADEAYPVLRRDLGFDMNKAEMLVDMYDRNKDYRLSLLEFIDFYNKVEELKVQVQNAFRDFDRNGDGFVDAAEAKAVLIPKGFSDQQIEALIHKFDLDGDGKLNYQEFTFFWDVQIV